MQPLPHHMHGHFAGKHGGQQHHHPGQVLVDVVLEGQEGHCRP